MKKTSLVMRVLLAFLFVVCPLAVFAQEVPGVAIPKESDTENFHGVALVQALNKTTAKTSILELKLGKKTQFGQIAITAHKCWKAPSYQKPESKILLEVSEMKNGEGEQKVEKIVFYGWMFASSPSISGLEHPIYDLIALSCKK